MKSLKANLTARPGQSTQAAPAKSHALTPWFPASVKPARAGLYETQEPDGSRWFNLFAGSDWHFGYMDAVMPNHLDVLPSKFLVRWRGLASDPAKDAA